MKCTVCGRTKGAHSAIGNKCPISDSEYSSFHKTNKYTEPTQPVDQLLDRIAALEARVSALEAERAAHHRLRHGDLNIGAYWQIAPQHMGQPVYEWHVDPSMRETRNG